MIFIHKYRLEIAVFLCGAAVMIYEVVGSRVLAPYLGTSLFVWTTLMSSILMSLSIGYYIGGKKADQEANYSYLSKIIFFSAILIIITLISKDLILTILSTIISNIQIGSIIASAILFVPASILLGIVSPYSLKLKLTNIKKTGTTYGNLSTLSTMGSIIGTFLTGFLLIPLMGTNLLLITLSIILTITSLLLSQKPLFEFKVITLLVLLILSIFIKKINFVQPGENFIDIDTQYNRIWIYDKYDEILNNKIRIFSIENRRSSVMYLDNNDLVSQYTQYYDLAEHFFPEFENTLMLGGAGYSYPKYFLQKYNEATIDVIEIDPKITQIAKDYFNLKESPRLTTYNMDARIFLNQSNKHYDVIFGDAFSSQYSIPYHLTTIETVQEMYDILSEKGVVLTNIVSSIEGSSGEFLRAEYRTFKEVFPQVFLFPVNDFKNGEKVQNIMLIALKNEEEPNLTSENPIMQKYLSHRWIKEVAEDKPVLTDNHAPIDYYISKTL